MDKKSVNPAYRETPSSGAIGKFIEDLNFTDIMKRRSWERRWYNTQWFDDGIHFRVMSRKTNQIIDHVQRQNGFIERAIPRASKQIRGIGALLLTPEYYPVVYPERISEEEYRIKSTNPQMNGQINQQAYQRAQQLAGENAKKEGIFLTRTWEDDLQLELKLMDMILLTLKNSISFMQIYTDPQTKRIRGDIFDSFDIIMEGNRRELDELRYMTKAIPWDFNEVLTSPIFDEDKLKEISPDNRYATSEVKDAYMRARYGTKIGASQQNTVIVRETFMKEYLTDENWDQAKKLSEDTGAMEHKSKGEVIMRHPFSVGGICLKDEYVDYDNYPFAELRMESGYLYQVPVMERFIPLNKTQDIVVTRLEKFINTMVAGIYMKRKGENFILSNVAGGTIAEYEGTPPSQMNVTNAGNTPFQFLEYVDKLIEEQGISSTNIAQLPNNIANNTIENIQQQEYTNLKFATARLRACVTRIGELCLERGDKDYIKPVEIGYEENNKVNYMQVIGSRGKKKHQEIGKGLPSDIVTLNRKHKIRIEADSGFGLTQDGRRHAMETLMQQATEAYKEGFLGAQAMSLLWKRFVEEYGFGSTEEFMEAIENGITQGQMSNQQIQQMKIALLQVLRDAKVTQGGMHEVLKNAGLIQESEQEGKPEAVLGPLVNLYKSSPPDIRRQVESLLGLTPSQDEPVTLDQAKSAKELHSVVKDKHDMAQEEQSAELEQKQVENEQFNKQQEQQLAEQQQRQPEPQQQVDNQNTSPQLQQSQ